MAIERNNGYNFLLDVEKAQYKLLCGLDALNFVQDVMARGEYPVDDCARAVNSVLDTLTEQNNKLGALVESEFDRRKKHENWTDRR